MKRKQIWIVSLLTLGLALTAAVVFWLLPAQERQQAQQRAAQTDARTHDFAAVRAYASPYVGNISNTVNLFYHLPLSDVPARFEIGDDASLCVRYQAALGAPLSELRGGTAMHDRVQARLGDAEFLAACCAQPDPDS